MYIIPFEISGVIPEKFSNNQYSYKDLRVLSFSFSNFSHLLLLNKSEVQIHRA